MMVPLPEEMDMMALFPADVIARVVMVVVLVIISVLAMFGRPIPAFLSTPWQPGM
jgi:hypothetical protein